MTEIMVEQPVFFQWGNISSIITNINWIPPLIVNKIKIIITTAEIWRKLESLWCIICLQKIIPQTYVQR